MFVLVLVSVCIAAVGRLRWKIMGSIVVLSVYSRAKNSPAVFRGQKYFFDFEQKFGIMVQICSSQKPANTP